MMQHLRRSRFRNSTRSCRANTPLLLWATNGTGTFDNAFIANAVYYPSEADLAGVELTLTVVTLECGELTESVTFDFQASPSINIIPDYDFVCFDENYDFTGKVKLKI